jgi:phage host-nuclease inhibitor protein Gam
MRKRFAVLVIAIASTAAAAGCVEPPTEQELDQMCRHLEVLRGEVSTTPLDQTIGDLETQFTARLEKLQGEADAALKAVDAELEAKLKETKTDDEKAKLNEEYAPKKDAAAKNIDAEMQALANERKGAIAKATADAEAAAKKLEENVKKCKTDRISADVSQETAQCRLKAKTVDDFWNKCM